MKTHDVQERLRSEIESLQNGARESVYGYKYGGGSCLDENGNYPDDYYADKDRLEAYGGILARNELLNLDAPGLDVLGIDADKFLRRFTESISQAYPGARDPIMVVLADIRGELNGPK